MWHSCSILFASILFGTQVILLDFLAEYMNIYVCANFSLGKTVLVYVGLENLLNLGSNDA